MTNPELEEKLREAACFGDIDGVKELINKYYFKICIFYFDGFY